MGKKIVVSTSTSCLDYYENNRNIPLIRIKLDIGGKLYADGTEMPADRFYKMLADDPTLIPKTTQVPVGELMTFFEDLYDQGYDQILVTTISSKLSGSINGVRTCASALADKMKIVAYDTKTVGFNEGIFALKATQMFEDGADFDDVIKELDSLQTRNIIMFGVEHLDFLVKNGRLSNAAGFAANMLNLKPLLEVQSSGEIVAVRRIRAIQRTLREVAVRAKEYTQGHEYYIYLTGTTDERLDYLREQVRLTTGDDNLLYTPMTPIVGCHVGNGAIGVGIFLKE